MQTKAMFSGFEEAFNRPSALAPPNDGTTMQVDGLRGQIAFPVCRHA
jgi:hypothetical protein